MLSFLYKYVCQGEQGPRNCSWGHSVSLFLADTIGVCISRPYHLEPGHCSSFGATSIDTSQSLGWCIRVRTEPANRSCQSQDNRYWTEQTCKPLFWPRSREGGWPSQSHGPFLPEKDWVPGNHRMWCQGALEGESEGSGFSPHSVAGACHLGLEISSDLTKVTRQTLG